VPRAIGVRPACDLTREGARTKVIIGLAVELSLTGTGGHDLTFRFRGD
jgi:hypothetical protein